MKQSKEGDFNWSEFEQEAIDRLKQGDELGGKEGVLAPMIKRLLESALEGELEHHLQGERANGSVNRRNGRQSKGLKTSMMQVESIF